MSKSSNPPSLSETAFVCPHCGAFTTQDWYKLLADRVDEKKRTLSMPSYDTRERIAKDEELEPDDRQRLIAWVDRILQGLVFIERNQKVAYANNNVENLHLSKCFNCKKVAVWVHRSLVFPAQKAGVLPNADLPADLIADFEEARSIVDRSPRGAAALMRLVVQKLCAHLGEKGKNIDEDIASLVAKGLNPLVQKALDIVRVVGNEAVHPGTLDLKDDQETAQHLFILVNSIAEQMITHPRSVQQLYNQLPVNKLAAIEARNDKALGGDTK